MEATTRPADVPEQSDDPLPAPTELQYWKAHEEGLAGLSEPVSGTLRARRDPDWDDVALPLPPEAMHADYGRLDSSLRARMDELEALESKLEAERVALQARGPREPPNWRGLFRRAKASDNDNDTDVRQRLQELQLHDKPSTKPKPSVPRVAAVTSATTKASEPEAAPRPLSRFKQRQLAKRAQDTRSP
jgi:hypothetical protein